MHATGEAEQFYRKLSAPALIDLEAVGNSQWLIELLERPASGVRQKRPLRVTSKPATLRG